MPCEPGPLKTRVTLVADLFCGAGGSSTGARRALASLGLQMNLVAVNHWNVAIETHAGTIPKRGTIARTSTRSSQPRLCLRGSSIS
jgi:site-specific DNA-cytosine methylase